jgi:putative FmdB family regulatory protein
VPIYAYSCEQCGPFEQWRPVVEAAAAAPCPSCGSPAARRFTPPGVALLSRPVRRALDAEEQSAHEPAVTSERRGRPLPHVHAPTPPWALGH